MKTSSIADETTVFKEILITLHRKQEIRLSALVYHYLGFAKKNVCYYNVIVN